MIKTFQKKSTETLDYLFDFSNWLTGTDTISSVSIPAVAGLTFATISNNTTSVKVVISGGTLNTNYKVTCQIITAAGLIKSSQFYLVIRE